MPGVVGAPTDHSRRVVEGDAANWCARSRVELLAVASRQFFRQCPRRRARLRPQRQELEAPQRVPQLVTLADVEEIEGACRRGERRERLRLFGFEQRGQPAMEAEGLHRSAQERPPSREGFSREDHEARTKPWWTSSSVSIITVLTSDLSSEPLHLIGSASRTSQRILSFPSPSRSTIDRFLRCWVWPAITLAFQSHRSVLSRKPRFSVNVPYFVPFGSLCENSLRPPSRCSSTSVSTVSPVHSVNPPAITLSNSTRNRKDR